MMQCAKVIHLAHHPLSFETLIQDIGNPLSELASWQAGRPPLCWVGSV